ncbi:MAG: hypothetical protein KDA52_18775 [Planctomycetaceae bacterium]|nr:hypothetical protein [Planctomycetaceae bacterium]
MVTKLPKERDFDPYGGGLDEQWAWKNFGGLTLDEAYEKFVSAPELYQENFMFMGERAFAFYYPVIDRFLRETIDLPVDERGDRQSWILPHCIRGQFIPANRRYVSALKQPVIDLCEFMLQHIQCFADDWDDPTEIENNWRHLQEHVRQYK